MDDGRRKRKVVRPRTVCFGEINESKLLSPLSLPSFTPRLPDECFIIRDFSFYVPKDMGESKNSVTICHLPFTLEISESVLLIEEQYLKDNENELKKARTNFFKFLDNQLVTDDGAINRTERNRALARGALERLDDLGIYQTAKGSSALSSHFPKYDNSLFVDGEGFELLSPKEFFQLWQRGFHEDIVDHVLSRTEWSARELSEYLHKNSSRANGKTLSVVRHRLHSQVEPLIVTLAGKDFIPNSPNDNWTLHEMTNDWEEALHRILRRRFIEEFI